MWIVIPFAADQFLFQVSSCGAINTGTTGSNGKAVTRTEGFLVTAGASLSYVFDNSNLDTGIAIPVGVADNATGQLSHDFKIVCTSDVLTFYCDGVLLTTTNPFSTSSSGSDPTPITLTEARIGPPTYVVYNGTPSNVQTWPLAMPAFSVNYSTGSLFWTDNIKSVEST